MAISRRKALQFSGVLVATTALNASNKIDGLKLKEAVKTNTSYNAPLSPAKGPRVVVVGGGWSGLSIAKYTKIFAPNADVVLVEQRYEFISGPLSNLWLVDKIELEFLTHDYLQAARENNYTYFHATAIDLDRKNRILKTSDGDVSFDYLVFAPGIDYDYSRWTKDIAFETRLRQEYPAGFIPGSEHITLRNKVLNFKGGNFILTVPSGNYRCMPAPYERACIIADYFKQKKLKAKVILLDENNAITIKKEGFQSAFDKLYSDYLEYHPNTKIQNIDLDKKIVETEFNEISFEEAAFYPHVRGAKILERVGIAKDANNMLEGDINTLTYEVNDEKDIYITGDSRPMGFSKSGNTSNSEGHYVATLIAQKINKSKKIKWESPTTACFSAVSIAPERAIYIYTQYAYNKTDSTFKFTSTSSSENWLKDGAVNADSNRAWATALYMDMFSK
ncbi:MAG: twin-arginine translocation pathway signal protein [Helicobacteraceae bacterium CG2_30_36_10]|nr:MAG: twin-arginine translocation pathway signal protein [Helicobacteraceae bacterium CG2_30_36_10]